MTDDIKLKRELVNIRKSIIDVLKEHAHIYECRVMGQKILDIIDERIRTKGEDDGSTHY